MNLYEYGILAEKSDIRAHVSVCNHFVYVFKTSAGVKAVQNGSYRVAEAYQPGVNGPTAQGWLVPIKDIEDLRELNFKSFNWSIFKDNASTTEKGICAVNCVVELLRLGRMPIWIDGAKETEDRALQIAGTDVLVFCNKRIQVKCDWNAGKTGNLFLQKSERNPLKMA